ncbi:TRAP-type C4-dicarboxylate transport system permease small subunit [Pseudomonas duriflava]|uniref:TRAP transporter small permease protein n=1 Tax=Pseudomonas duriflava TaxID=459528 RepID=A0A562QQ50_9PSED|nr:TRAP transporter small permease [Pseudomonas duriflava]TWI58330.1 TRAP-type C4-dicarboxylate transport system permease small subunit [Pseudomonas duriflava]
MTKLVDLYFHLIKVLLVICMLGMVILVFGNVVLRYAFNSGISVSEELSRWFFVYMVFLGAILGLKERSHIGMDSLIRALPTAGKRVCLTVAHLLVLYILWLVVQGSWQQAVINKDVVAPASGLSMALFYAAGLIFGVTSFGIMLYELYVVLLHPLDHYVSQPVTDQQDTHIATTPKTASRETH